MQLSTQKGTPLADFIGYDARMIGDIVFHLKPGELVAYHRDPSAVDLAGPAFCPPLPYSLDASDAELRKCFKGWLDAHIGATPSYTEALVDSMVTASRRFRPKVTIA